MTKEEKEIIIKMHNEGVGYDSIAKIMGISKGTVSSFFLRLSKKKVCLNCGKEFDISKNKHFRKFCSAKCCKNYWVKYGNKHKVETKICPTCGSTFSTYRHNTFCSHECYLKSIRKEVVNDGREHR